MELNPNQSVVDDETRSNVAALIQRIEERNRSNLANPRPLAVIRQSLSQVAIGEALE